MAVCYSVIERGMRKNNYTYNHVVNKEAVQDLEIKEQAIRMLQAALITARQ